MAEDNKILKKRHLCNDNLFLKGVYRRQKEYVPENSKFLQEAKVCVMDNEQCAKKWAQRFRTIINQYMICTKDVMKQLSELCDVSKEEI